MEFKSLKTSLMIIKSEVQNFSFTLIAKGIKRPLILILLLKLFFENYKQYKFYK